MIILRMLASFLVGLIPRFETEDWAVEYVGDGSHEVEPVKCMQYVDPDEEYDGIASLSYFTWFGVAFGGSGVVMMRPWVNPHDERTEV